MAWMMWALSVTGPGSLIVDVGSGLLMSTVMAGIFSFSICAHNWKVDEHSLLVFPFCFWDCVLRKQTQTNTLLTFSFSVLI